MSKQIVPMELSDIFEKTFTLIGKTFFRNLIIALLFLGLPLILMAIAADDFSSSIADLQETIKNAHGESIFDVFISMLETLSFFGAASLLLMLGSLLAEIAISVVVSEELMSYSISVTDAIDETFSGRWLHGIGQALLKIAIVAGAAIIVIIAAVMLAVVSKLLMVLFVLICCIGLVPLMLNVFLKWYFSLTAVAVDDMTAVESLRGSWDLVTGYWWRTFGILFLFSLIMQLVITIVSLPITFGSMWDAYREYFTILGKTGGKIDPVTMKNLEASFGPGISIGTGVSALLTLLIAPVYTVVMYFDLRARSQAPAQSYSTPALQDPSSIDFDRM
jgi:hypothetical protein